MQIYILMHFHFHDYYIHIFKNMDVFQGCGIIDFVDLIVEATKVVNGKHSFPF